ncbi:hypothetical protein M885DRAFT_520342 [Pelagophyceae sp. CCMP2097]|nr:hypothetical protein M885DRAFT_520342 [Pelagophyceae sp. CCMP2097]
MRRDAWELFPDCAGAMCAALSALDVCGAARVSRAWQAASRTVLDHRHAQLRDAVATATVVASSGVDGESDIESGLLLMIHKIGWVPQVCIVFATEESDALRDGELARAAAARLAPGCLVVGASGERVIGPEAPGGAGVELGCDGVAVLLLRCGGGARPPALLALPARPRAPTRPSQLAGRGFTCAGGTAAVDSDAGLRAAVARAHGARPFADAGALCAAFVERWVDALGAGSAAAGGARKPHQTHVTFFRDADCAQACLGADARGHPGLGSGHCGSVVGGLASATEELFAGRASAVAAAACVVLTFFDSPTEHFAARCVSVADGQGAGYGPLCQRELAAQRVQTTASRVSASIRAADAAPLAPAFGLTITCIARDVRFHGGGVNVEASAHTSLLGPIPLIGFFANGEIGPCKPDAAWSDSAQGDEDSDDGDAPAQYALHGYTTCLALFGSTRG